MLTPVNDRMQKILCRTRQLRRKQELRSSAALSAACLLLAGGIAALLQQNSAPGCSVVLAGYGAVLLHSGTEGYVVLSVVSFVVGALFAFLCLRYRQRRPHCPREHAESRVSSPPRDPGQS